MSTARLLAIVCCMAGCATSKPARPASSTNLYRENLSKQLDAARAQLSAASAAWATFQKEHGTLEVLNGKIEGLRRKIEALNERLKHAQRRTLSDLQAELNQTVSKEFDLVSLEVRGKRLRAEQEHAARDVEELEARLARARQ